MLCPLCEEYDEKESSVKAHICGRHDADHSGYVGLKDNGEPLSREENERRKQEAKPELELEELEPEAEEESDSGNAVAGGLAAAFAGLVAKEYLENKKDNERGRI